MKPHCCKRRLGAGAGTNCHAATAVISHPPLTHAHTSTLLHPPFPLVPTKEQGPPLAHFRCVRVGHPLIAPRALPSDATARGSEKLHLALPTGGAREAQPRGHVDSARHPPARPISEAGSLATRSKITGPSAAMPTSLCPPPPPSPLLTEHSRMVAHWCTHTSALSPQPWHKSGSTDREGTQPPSKR